MGDVINTLIINVLRLFLCFCLLKLTNKANRREWFLKGSIPFHGTKPPIVAHHFL